MPKRKNSNAEIKVYRRREGGRCYDILSMRQQDNNPGIAELAAMSDSVPNHMIENEPDGGGEKLRSSEEASNKEASRIYTTF